MSRIQGGRRARQQVLQFRMHGGARRGAGRKARGDRAGVSHAPRQHLTAAQPVHVTLKLAKGLPVLRRKREYEVLRAAFLAGCERFGFRLVHYAVLSDHLHLVVEADGRTALTRGLQGLVIRIAKALNRLWQRTGPVFADRYHERVMKSPLEVRRVLRYVLGNAGKHAAEGHSLPGVRRPLDVFTSGPWFDGWTEPVVIRSAAPVVRPTAAARSWLLTTGWRRHGLLRFEEASPSPTAR